jgi:Fe2+ transport system protein B
MEKKDIKKHFEQNKEENRNKILASNNLERSIKNLSKPSFLGSYHLNRSLYQKNSSLNTIINDELQLEMNKSIKNTVFNPITKILIIIAILFNLFWFLFIYIL